MQVQMKRQKIHEKGLGTSQVQKTSFMPLMKTGSFLVVTSFLLLLTNCTTSVENRFDYEQTYQSLKTQLDQHEINLSAPFKILLRAFKLEEELQVWVKSNDNLAFQHWKTYNFCKNSGTLGPKRKEGDRQIPEGFYHIDRFNPKSKYHLSLGINYPNPADLIKGDPRQPGSNIFIHGGCSTIGCITIGDNNIEELYVLAEAAKNQGQHRIAVQIFPAKLEGPQMTNICKEHPEHTAFWQSLQLGYTLFEREQIPAAFSISSEGAYIFH